MACTIRQMEVQLNGIRQFSTVIKTDKDYILVFDGSIEALKNDIITLVVYHENGSDLNVIPSIAISRVTYVEHGKDVGKNLIENEDGTNG